MKDATDAEARTYLDAGWWSTTPLSEVVRSHTEMRPGAPAYIVIGSQRDQTLTWEAYDRYATELAAAFVEDGFAPGERIAVLLPDGAAVHICYIAAERAGLVVTGIGARAGIAEIRYLLDKTGAKGLITHDRHRGTPATSLCRQVAEHQISPRPVADNGALRHIVVPRWLGDDRRPVTINGRPINPPPFEQARQILSGRELGTDDLFMLNSTSGTTGLPKCVMHSQNRWFYFHHVVTNAGTLTGDDVFMGAIPALWLWPLDGTLHAGHLGVADGRHGAIQRRRNDGSDRAL
jgi:acyl-CoA synthetase